MNSRIKLLPELVINQIAAGEVIERPASIVKELLENSIDANSSLIRVYIEHGGINTIKIVDNGDGIHSDDLPLVCKQHATSKITTMEDLNTIQSLGFRGEALASIDSVAKVNIMSQQQQPSGTSIDVRDLFYNVPARRKFLKSATTEFNYIQEIFKRIALSNYQVGFMLYHNNKLVKNLPKIDLKLDDNIINQEQRIIKLLGKNFINQSMFFQTSSNNIDISGWLATEIGVSSSAIQYFYINNRVVKDRLLNAAVKQAMQELAITPAYCLYLQLDPSLFDVNVHPTKQEVRFANPKIIYTLIKDSIIEAFNQFKLDNCGKLSPNNNLNNNNLINNSNLNIYDNNIGFNSNDIAENSVIAENSAEISNHIVNNQDKLKIFAIFDNRYLICEKYINSSKNIMLVNVRSSLLWLLRKKISNYSQVESCQLIIPERIQLSISTGISYGLDNIEDYAQLLQKLGFSVNQIHEDTLLISMIPQLFKQLNVDINYQKFLTDLLKIKLIDLNDAVIIDLLLQNVIFNRLDLYNKNDLIKLIEELISENFEFLIVDECKFANLIPLI